MKKIFLSLLACAGVFSAVCWAQPVPQPPASWVEFKKDEDAKRAAFLKQMRDEREAFLSAHPEVKAYFDQIRALRQTQGKTIRNHHTGL